ncbi:succinylglutamate desuccinylase/aspartoacylase family protein [candidate division KSB1 bacterium]
MQKRRFVNLLLIMVFICVFVNPLYSQETIKVGEVTAQPGEKVSGFITVPAGSDAPEIKLPVSVINGTRPGPVLALTAGVHGYEYPPVLAMQRVREKLDPAEISGTVIIVHIVNLPSFLKRTIYYNPFDWKNQNRVFPGKIDGTSTERIAFMVTQEVIDQCDYLIDNHCGDGNEDLTPYLYCTITGDEVLDKKIRDLAVNYGLKMIINDRDSPKDVNASVMCDNAAITRGKPALTIESGRMGGTGEEDILRIIRGTYNTLKHLKMIKGEPELLFDPIWVEKVTYVRSEFEGLFYPIVKGGQHVEEGEMLGYLTDFFGNIIQKAIAPHDGIVLYVISTPPMSTGEPMAKIGSFIR